MGGDEGEGAEQQQQQQRLRQQSWLLEWLESSIEELSPLCILEVLALPVEGGEADGDGEGEVEGRGERGARGLEDEINGTRIRSRAPSARLEGLKVRECSCGGNQA